MNNARILIKTKGGHKEGMGDVTSSLALAKGFKEQEYNNLHFIINNHKNIIGIVIESGFKGFVAEELSVLETYLQKQPFDIVILNQLNTPIDETLLFKKHSKLLVTIEDTGDSAKLADLRFNVFYPFPNSFSDFSFIPLSSVFQQKHNRDRLVKRSVKSIMVTQGGSDTHGFTPKVVRALYGIAYDININVILGPNFLHDSELKEVLNEAPRKFDIIRGKNDLSDLMLEADLAISAGGNTLFELACLGLPPIVVCGEIFEVETANRLQEKGFGISLGFGKDITEREIFDAVNQLTHDVDLRLEMSKKGKELVDGLGTKRMVDIINKSFQDRTYCVQAQDGNLSE